MSATSPIAGPNCCASNGRGAHNTPDSSQFYIQHRECIQFVYRPANTSARTEPGQSVPPNFKEPSRVAPLADRWRPRW
eukprot:3797710-Pyramimonas_sp.AAC.1